MLTISQRDCFSQLIAIQMLQIIHSILRHNVLLSNHSFDALLFMWLDVGTIARHRWNYIHYIFFHKQHEASGCNQKLT